MHSKQAGRQEGRFSRLYCVRDSRYVSLAHACGGRSVHVFSRAASQGDDAVVGYLRYCREQGMNYKSEIHDQLQGGLYTYKVGAWVCVRVWRQEGGQGS